MWLYQVNRVLTPVLKSYWRLGAVGAVQSVPREGPVLVASNHLSYLDPWLVGMCFSRDIRFLINGSWYERSRIWNAFFKAYGAIPVQSQGAQTIDMVCRLLEKDEMVGLFPEGRISTDGKIRRFRPGVSVMAARSGAPVVPVGIRGSYESFPKSASVPKPVKVTIHVGEPRRFPGAPYGSSSSSEESRAFLTLIYEDVCRLAGQEAAAPDSDSPAQTT